MLTYMIPALSMDVNVNLCDLLALNHISAHLYIPSRRLLSIRYLPPLQMEVSFPVKKVKCQKRKEESGGLLIECSGGWKGPSPLLTCTTLQMKDREQRKEN